MYLSRPSLWRSSLISVTGVPHKTPTFSLYWTASRGCRAACGHSGSTQAGSSHPRAEQAPRCPRPPFSLPSRHSPPQPPRRRSVPRGGGSGRCLTGAGGVRGLPALRRVRAGGGAGPGAVCGGRRRGGLRKKGWTFTLQYALFPLFFRRKR